MNKSPFEAFLSYLSSERGLSQNTIEAYRSDLEQLESLLPKGVLASQKEDIRSTLARLQKDGLTSRSLARKVSALRHFYRWAMRKRLIQEIPLRNIPIPKMPKTLPKPVSNDIFHQLLAVIDRSSLLGLRDYAMLRLLDASGIRDSELVHLKIADICFEDGFLIIRHGKGDKDRFAPFDEEARKALEQYLGIARPKLYPNDDSACVFPITRQAVWHRVQHLCREAKVASHHPHQFRHRFCTELVRSGLELREVADLAGHSSSDTTQLYVSLDLDYAREVFRKFHPRAVRQ